MRGFGGLAHGQISAWPEVRLVERARIKSVLSELSLNAGGLVAPERAIRFGELSQADAQVLIEKLADSKSSLVRVWVVESRTSMKLLDVTLPSEGFKNDLDALQRELKQVQAKLTVSDANRRLIGIAAIKSEEPGTALATHCRALTAMVEGSLHRRPELVVVEREQLRRLVAEKDLTGIEQRLRSSAWLVEAGVRRIEGNRGLAITGRIHSPGRGVQQKLQLEIPTQDWARAANELAQAIEQALGRRAIPLDAAELAAEADLFGKRRDWFLSSHRFDEGCECAEAALALAPTEANVLAAYAAYWQHAHALNGPMKYDEALPPARRCQELRLEWWQKSQRGDRIRTKLAELGPFRPHVRLPLRAESAESQAVRAECDRLSETTFELMLADAASPRERWNVLLYKLAYLDYLSQTSRNFAENLPALVAALQTEMPLAKIKPEFTDAQYGLFLKLLFATITEATKHVGSSSLAWNTRVWKRDELAPAYLQLARQQDQAVRAAVLYGLVGMGGDEAQPAAQSLYALVKSWPTITVEGLNLTDRLTSIALQGLHDPEAYAAFIEGLIAKSLEQRTPQPLLNYSGTVYFHLFNLPPDRKLAQYERDLAPLEIKPLPAALVYSAERFRSELRNHMKERGLIDDSQFSVAGGEGFWREYQARPIRLERSAKQGAVLEVVVDRRPDAAANGGEIVLVTSNRVRQLSVERVGRSGGMPKKFGVDIPGSPRPFGGVQLAFGDDAIYVASETSGFVILHHDHFELVDEAQGAPAPSVERMVWCQGRLYVSYRNALVRFDPAKKSFEMIASAISVEPRNKLDGGGSFWLTEMLADEEHGHLYFNVQDNVLPGPRYGVWRYDTHKGTLDQLDTRACRISWNDGGILLDAGQKWSHAPHAWSWIDTKTGRTTALEGYAPHQPPLVSSSALSRFVRVGDHLISAQGQLYSPGGGTHLVRIEHPWKWLARLGPGFITHYDSQINTLWYVERKPAEEREGGK